MKKYEFTDDKIEFYGRVLTRIRALVDIPRFNVKAGDLGGYIEHEGNLSHKGDCWVGDNALAFGSALVFGGACVSGDAKVYGSAWIAGNARVFGYAQVFDNSQVFGNAYVFDNARVYGDARVSGNVRIFAYIRISGNAKIESNDDFIVLGPAKSSDRYTIAYKTQDSKIRVLCGCFAGTPDEFLEAINVTHANNEEFHNQYLDFHKQIVEKFKNL